MDATLFLFFCYFSPQAMQDVDKFVVFLEQIWKI